MITPIAAVDAINERYGRHPRARGLHAKGTLCAGTFTATPEAARLTRAAHMQGDSIPVTARLSNGSGDPASRDPEPDVRGLAVTFHLPDGERTDISAQTAPAFPVRTPDEFIELLHAAAPGRSRLWRLPLFLARHPYTLKTLKANAPGLKPPASYATIPYYAIHAFRWADAGDGTRWVRYTWRPEAAADGASRGEGDDYLHDELVARLERGPVRFRLELQIAADGDPTDDPSASWPEDRETVEAGTLELTGLSDGDPDLVFDPMRLTDGIEPSADPVLLFRPQAYSISAERRTS